jgi:hypothetical protein
MQRGAQPKPTALGLGEEVIAHSSACGQHRDRAVTAAGEETGSVR